MLEARGLCEVLPRHRGGEGRQLHDGAGRGPRLPRPERRGQVHHRRHPDRPHRADGRAGLLRRRATSTRDLVEFRRHLGYVPEEPHLYPFLSGREYLELVGPPARDARPRVLAPRIDGLLELLGLGGATRPGDRRLLEGHAAEGADRGRPAARPRGADLRRAALRPRRHHGARVPAARRAARAQRARSSSTARTSSRSSRRSAPASSCCTAGASSPTTRWSTCAT